MSRCKVCLAAICLLSDGSASPMRRSYLQTATMTNPGPFTDGWMQLQPPQWPCPVEFEHPRESSATVTSGGAWSAADWRYMDIPSTCVGRVGSRPPLETVSSWSIGDILVMLQENTALPTLRSFKSQACLKVGGACCQTHVQCHANHPIAVPMLSSQLACCWCAGSVTDTRQPSCG